MDQTPTPAPELAQCPACGRPTLDTTDTGRKIVFFCTADDCDYSHGIPAAPADHTPCCSAHGQPMDCERYRRTHFVEVRPCCRKDADRLRQEQAAADVARRNQEAAATQLP